MPALAPLVEPGEPLTTAERERYSRHILLPEIGLLGQRRLKNARVLVIGAGGLGSPVLLYLAAAGVGTIGIVDHDTVDLSNLQRQVIHGVADLGRSKLQSAAAAVAELNPLVTVHQHDVWLSAANALELFARYDLILDGADTFATRYLVSDAAALLGKPCVWGSILRFDGQVSVFWNRHGPTYRDLYPEAPTAGTVPGCGEGGVFGMLCGTIGSTMVAEAVKLITGVGRTLLGRVVLFNALDASWREITIAPDPATEPFTELIDYDLFCGTPPASPQGDQSISVHQLAAMLDARSRGELDFDLVDVREPEEYAIVHIAGSLLVPKGGILSGQARLARDRDIIVHCKAGPRAAAVLAELQRRGYAQVRQVEGGIVAWTREIEPALPTY
ncbi:molybdopterin-synthase adenylyltransferase MoeB [Cryobacterium luteum]|uniref:Molybdopterin-synthase adenylyltransferase MoeB n=1 Tax=Cryobacterium luteum TaxID=1424661 RepID=A0A1H8AK93_9MICO|nr:molybdopterin-synthase adenylyltransferase MoeB [Cryobacterium luteum]TFB88753.1 molybdopterin-synthase adenylyltransferase MoeB [Cryobacterium luteum]SEM70916.1 adenylyltransferase and sulfurtransferase [Cryobacterium luteum]